MVKGFISNGKWHLPGGGCHASESYLVAAKREVYEEIGLDLHLESLKPLYEGELYSEEFGFRYMLYIAEMDLRRPLARQKFELTEALWIDISELDATNSGKEVIEAIRSASAA